jgi:hypothetical protein
VIVSVAGCWEDVSGREDIPCPCVCVLKEKKSL